MISLSNLWLTFLIILVGYCWINVNVAVVVEAYRSSPTGNCCCCCANHHHHPMPNFDITPPTLRSDWTQMSELMVHCLLFEKDDEEDLSWRLYGKYFVRQQIYQRLIQTARTMQDMKYSILVAKEQPEFATTASSSSGGGRVIGMIEFGVCMMNRNHNSSIISTTNNSGRRNNDIISTVDQTQCRWLMIGSVTVDPQYRKRGIATALIRQCETIVQQQWKESELYAHVEQTNHVAIQCFTKLGYTSDEDAVSTPVYYINVRRRHKVECVPHLLFMKKL